MTAKKCLQAISLLFLFFTPFACAQTSEIDQLINALQSKYNGLSTLSADFTQLYTARNERARRESGRLNLKKPGKMRWDYTSPETKLFISDGRTLYEYATADRFATRSSVKESDDLRAPLMFLLGRGNLRRDFKSIQFSGESPAQAGNKVLRLIPKRAQDFRELLLEIDPGSLQIQRLTLVGGDGGRSDFLFSNIRENAPLSESLFQFKPPAGVKVIDN